MKMDVREIVNFLRFTPPSMANKPKKPESTPIYGGIPTSYPLLSGIGFEASFGSKKT
jgi:hypothetical protein